MLCPQFLLVEVILLGGVPNPVVLLNGTDSLALCSLVSNAVQRSQDDCSTRVIGFVGWRVLHDGGNHLIQGDSSFDILMQRQPAFLQLNATVRDHVISAALSMTSRCSKGGVDRKSEGVVEESRADAKSGGGCTTAVVGPDDPTKVNYAPLTDDSGCFLTRQGDNNCYDYANDIATNTFAQPGRGSGVCKRTARPCVANNCASVRSAAESDGLEWIGTALPTALPESGHYVSLHIWPSSNFHWLRMDANLLWSHKPGGSPVRNKDNDGHIISDPSKANVSPWSVHCGYMRTQPSNVTIY